MPLQEIACDRPAPPVRFVLPLQWRVRISLRQTSPISSGKTFDIAPQTALESGSIGEGFRQKLAQTVRPDWPGAALPPAGQADRVIRGVPPEPHTGFFRRPRAGFPCLDRGAAAHQSTQQRGSLHRPPVPPPRTISKFQLPEAPSHNRRQQGHPLGGEHPAHRSAAHPSLLSLRSMGGKRATRARPVRRATWKRKRRGLNGCERKRARRSGPASRNTLHRDR